MRRMNSMLLGHQGASRAHGLHVLLDREARRGIVPRQRQVHDAARHMILVSDCLNRVLAGPRSLIIRGHFAIAQERASHRAHFAARRRGHCRRKVQVKRQGRLLWSYDGLLGDLFGGVDIFFHQERRERKHVSNIIKAIADVIGGEIVRYASCPVLSLIFSTPNRSRIVLSYSSRFRRRSVTCPRSLIGNRPW